MIPASVIMDFEILMGSVEKVSDPKLTEILEWMIFENEHVYVLYGSFGENVDLTRNILL